MSGNTSEQLLVEVEGDDGKVTQVRPEKKADEADKEPKDAKDISDPEEGLESLRAQLAKAKENEAAADARARAAEERQRGTQTEAVTAKQREIVAHKAAAEQALEATGTALEAAKAKYKAAMEEGDYAASAEAQAEISEAVLRQNQARSYQARVARAEEVARAEAERPPPAEGVDTSGLPPRTRAWVERNRDKFSDPRIDARVKAAYFSAQAEGIEVESDAFFKRLDAAVAGKQFEEDEDPPVRRSNGSGTAAPPSRGGGLGGSGKPRVVRLTRDEVEAARSMNMSETEYAQDLIDDPQSRLYRKQ